jgi:signal transduction histidine kinase
VYVDGGHGHHGVHPRPGKPEGLASLWAFCEIGWNLAQDADTALTWMRASALGWVPIGPVALQALECRLLPAGGTPVDVSLTTLVHRDRVGGPSEMVMIVRDIREVVALRGRLLTSGRMAAVGELAAGIAHELNNPIAFVRANLSVLREHVQAICKELGHSPQAAKLAPVLAEAEEIVDESLEGMGRAAGIVRDVREFSHAGSNERRSADLRDLLEQSIRVARLQLPRKGRAHPGGAAARSV